MIFLSINNIEELVFTDKKVREVLPSYKYLFDSYDLSKVSPALKQLGIRCFNDFLKKVNQNDLELLSKYLKNEIKVEFINTDCVKNIDCNFDEVEFYLPNNYNNIDLCVYRKGESLNITLWK